MLLPSAHAGMTVSLMPSKRWGNFAEDILFTEKDVRLAFIPAANSTTKSLDI